jgi:PAS domain S-box-containing protein
MNTKGAKRRESNSKLRETLERSEKRFRVFQELSLDGFAQLRARRDAAGQIEDWEWIYANPAAERMLQREGVPLVGRRLLQDAPGDALARELFDHCVQVLADAQPRDFELECHRDDHRDWLWITAVQVDEGVAVSFKDITRRKENERALRKFLASLQAIFANTFHSFAFLDREGRIQAFNEIARQQAREVLGAELQVGRSIRDFVRPAERADFDQHFTRALAGETVRVERNFSPPGQPVAWFEYYYTPVNDESSSASGVLFSALPINERKQLEHRREAQREATPEHFPGGQRARSHPTVRGRGVVAGQNGRWRAVPARRDGVRFRAAGTGSAAAGLAGAGAFRSRRLTAGHGVERPATGVRPPGGLARTARRSDDVRRPRSGAPALARPARRERLPVPGRRRHEGFFRRAAG